MKLTPLDPSKQALLDTLAHELLTPLTSITGYTQLLEDGAAGTLTADQQPLLSAIATACAHLERQLRGVLDATQAAAYRLDAAHPAQRATATPRARAARAASRTRAVSLAA